MSKTQIAHRTVTYTRPASFCHPGGKATLDIYVYDNGDVKLYPDSNPATLTREEWAKLVLTVESVELPTSEPETTKDVVESSESVAIATDA